MAEPGFFERWGKRKAAARQGVPIPEPLLEPSDTAKNLDAPATIVSRVETADANGSDAKQGPPDRPPLTLEDAASLSPASDFKPFMAQQVSPDVRNAAMKKLFADPHYNVMDGLDTYIDDYSKPDPIPAAMLRQMVSAQFLNLFADEPAAKAAGPTEDFSKPVKPEHDHTDLQLQPNDAAPAEGSGECPA